MLDDNRWKISELLVKFELEPTLCDIFVEGAFDQEIVSRCFEFTNNAHKVVYAIDSVEVPDTLLMSHNLTDGNKQRVLALAKELSTIKEDCSYKCMVDKDLDHWLNNVEDIKRLVWTEYCSIDLYFFKEEILQDILVTTSKAKISNWSIYIKSLIKTFRIIFIIRLVDRKLSLNMKWIDLSKYLSKHENQIIFNDKDYITRLLNKNSFNDKKEAFNNEIKIWEARLTGDPRLYCRGHDLISLLSWTIEKFHGVKGFDSDAAIERLFVLLAPKISQDISLLLD